jgi:hypothetical protein
MTQRPTARTFILILLGSMVTALAVGLFGAIAAVFLYDNGRSKGNDLAVALIALHSVGTFVFVTLLTYLWSRRLRITWRVPIVALAGCFTLLVVNTIVASSTYDEYYSEFFYAAWLAVFVSGITALAVCRRILSRALTVDQGHPFTDS